MSQALTRKSSGLPVGYPPNQAKRDLAYHQLRRLLILQQIPAGSRLTESEWTLRLSVNRSALREAFARLEAEGLIGRGPKTGYVVPDLSRKDIYEVITVRFALESCAIEFLCQAGLNTPERLERMREACDLLERLVADDYQLSTVEADWRFHEALIEATGNRRLAIAYRHAPVTLFHPDITCGPQWAHRTRQTIEEHRAVLAATLEGRVPRARELLRAHLMDAWEERKRAAPVARGG